MKFEKLENIAEIIAGQSPPSSTYNKDGDGIPFFQGKADYGKIYPVVRNWCTKPTKISLPNDILISVRAPVGPVNINNIEACIGRGLSAIRVKDNFSMQYVFSFLKANEIKIANLGVGSTFTAITQKDLKDLIIPTPDYQTQLHIANILSKAESLIAQRKESIRLLDEYLKSVFLEMFGDKEYRKEKLGTVIYIQSGQVNPNELPYSEMYHVGGANIESDTGKIFNLKKAKSENLISGKYYFEEDFILYSKIRPYLNKVATPDFKGICSADIYPIKPNSDLLKKDYLRFVLMSEEFLTYTASQSDRTNIPKVNRKALDNFNISIPPIEFQIKFAQIVEKTEALKAQYQQSLQELENLYGSLSQKAFSSPETFVKGDKGELSIKDESLLMAAELGRSMAAEPNVEYKKTIKS